MLKKILIGAIFLCSMRALAEPPKPPQPPAANPHPAVTAKDKERVAFAVEQIKAKYGKKLEIRHPHVIPWAFEKFEKNRKDSGHNGDANLAMTPMLKPDEYMIHAYVLFENDWHHMDVILTESVKGEISLRGFFHIPMPANAQDLPEGVDC